MSVQYCLYTEAKINDEWICLNAQPPKVNTENDSVLSETIHGGSRFVFSCAADKLEELGFPIPYSELSAGLQQEYASAYSEPDMHFTSIDFEGIKSSIPDPILKEFHGYVLKDDIFQYETKESDDIYEWLGVDEYSELPDDIKKAYQYYEWNNPTGWYVPFLDIMEHVKWQVYDFKSVNYYSNPQELRIIMVMQ